MNELSILAAALAGASLSASTILGWIWYIIWKYGPKLILNVLADRSGVWKEAICEVAKEKCDE